MPYFDENGNEVEGLLTEDQLNEKLEEERSALTEKYEAEKSQALERAGALEAEKTRLEGQIEAAKAAGAKDDGGSGDKDTNLVALREKLEKTESALEEERKANMERFQTFQNDRVDAQIKAIAGEDAALAEKIRHNYNNVLTGMKSETAEEISAKVQTAAKLSVDPSDTPDPLSVAVGGASRGTGVPNTGDGKKKFSTVEVESGKKFGISDADREKYGNDPRLK